MKLLIAFIFVMTSTLALAEEVHTDCPWANQDNRTAGKAVKESSSSTKKTRASAVRSE